MNINIENIPNYRIAYIRQLGPYGQNNVQIVDQLKLWAHSNELLDENSIILSRCDLSNVGSVLLILRYLNVKFLVIRSAKRL